MTNIRFIPVLIVCLFITVIGQAQSKIGLRAGVLISKQDFKEGMLTTDPKSKFGADLALLAEFGLGNVVAISPEFHWIQKGSKIEDINGPLSESSRTFNYLEVPVLLKLRFEKGLGFFLFAGPSFGYLLDGSDKDEDGSTTDIDLDFYKRIELGGHIGGGIVLGPLNVDIRYIVGFSNIADHYTDGNGNDFNIKNSGFGAGVSFIF